MSRLWCLALLFLTLASCKKEVDEPAPWVCSPCGTYDIIVNDIVHTPLFSSPIDSVPTILVVEAITTNSLQVSFDLAPILGATDTVLLIVDDCTLEGTNLHGQCSFLYDSLAQIDIVLESNLINTWQDISGTISLTNDALAELEFDGVKQ